MLLIVSRKTPVYVLLIDASKAFDRVSHIKLFNTLQAHSICPLIIRVLYEIIIIEVDIRLKSELLLFGFCTFHIFGYLRDHTTQVSYCC